MKKSKIVPALVLASTFLLAACGPEQEPSCSHVDENHDQVCDNCGEAVVTAHTFDQTTVKNENTLKEEANCSHGNIYFKTCECGAIATSETDIWEDTATKLEHVDTDPVDHVCDLCGTTIGTHVFDQTTVKDQTTLVAEADCTHGDIYFKTCVCGEVSTSQTDTWEDTSTKLEHVDSEPNFICDNCGAELPGVAGITLDYLTGYIGPGESVTLTAVVEAYGGASEEVEWHIEKSTGASWTNYPQYDLEDIFTLVDNNDGTATLTGRNDLYISEFSCYVYATSKYDSNISSNKTEKIFYQAWNADKRSKLNTFFGEDKWNTIPFFPSCTLTLKDSNMTLHGYNTYKRTLKQMVASFDNQGVWTKGYVDSYEANYTLIKDGYLYTCVMDEDYYKSSKYYPEFTITKTEYLTEWPTSKVAGLVTGLSATGTVPAFESGISYEIHEADGWGDYSSVIVTVEDANAALDAYIQTLQTAEWFLYRTQSTWNYYGLEGETLLICPYVSQGKLVIEFDVNDNPVSKPLTAWPADTVASVLTLEEETAVAPTGTKFEIVSQDTNTITIRVYGTDTTYTAALETANYTKDSSSYYHPIFTSPTGTVVITVDLDMYSDGVFTVTLTSKLPAGVSTTFPLDEVKGIIKGDEADDVISATGTRFTLTENDEYDVTVKVEGGDKTAFETALGVAGFNSGMAGCFSKGNLCCDTQTVDGGFTINYYLAEKPEPTGTLAWWPESQIAEILGADANKIPCPTTASNCSFTKNSSTDFTLAFTGISAFDYKALLIDAGFTFDGMSYSIAINGGTLYADVTGSTNASVNFYIW